MSNFKTQVYDNWGVTNERITAVQESVSQTAAEVQSAHERTSALETRVTEEIEATTNTMSTQISELSTAVNTQIENEVSQLNARIDELTETNTQLRNAIVEIFNRLEASAAGLNVTSLYTVNFFERR